MTESADEPRLPEVRGQVSYRGEERPPPDIIHAAMLEQCQDCICNVDIFREGLMWAVVYHHD